ncbi:MAG: type I-B CRISPR-associated protein Cas8b1/Cst1 [candidate division WOR-3 bacterium]
MGNKISFIPSNWLYNASVIGFLKVLESFDKHSFEFKDGGEIEIDRETIKKSYEKIFEYHKTHFEEEFKIWGNNKRYPNYIQPKQKDFFEKYYIESLSNVREGNSKKCSWCRGYFLSDEELNSLKKKFSGNFEKFITQREIFQAIHLRELGGAITEMPNSFWNLKFSLPICHLCSYLIIFHHFSFCKIDRNTEIFINAPDFRLIWDLNKFGEIFKEKYEIKEILGLSLLKWAERRKVLLGSWTIMNIEVIIKRSEGGKFFIDYFDLPYSITKILLDYEIANLINQINEEKIFELILNGKFTELEMVNYYVLKTLLKLKNKENISQNDPIIKYLSEDKYKKKVYLEKIAKILPELYGKILKHLEREVKMNKNIDRLMEKLKAKGTEFSQKEVGKSINDIAYKLLEQIRLGNKDNVYYLLLRCFVANKEKMPEELIDVFKLENDKYFKTLIFSFLASILGGEV